MNPADMFLGAALILVGLISWASCCDRRAWNKGYCRLCNEPWESFDVDSQGGRGYKDTNGHTIWISYPVDRYRRDPNDRFYPEASEF